jgi:hypothetical protein
LLWFLVCSWYLLVVVSSGCCRVDVRVDGVMEMALYFLRMEEELRKRCSVLEDVGWCVVYRLFFPSRVKGGGGMLAVFFL